MKSHIAIIGMGYIGTSLAAALTNAGHYVIGIERDKSKREYLLRGESHLLEPGIDELLYNAHETKNLKIVPSFSYDWATLDIVVICVGPQEIDDTEVNTAKDSWDLFRFNRVLEEIGEEIYKRKPSTPLNIVIAATVRPQDYEFAKDTLEKHSRGYHGTSFILTISPMFLREGSMLNDLRRPPFIINGTSDGKSNSASKAWREILLSLVDPNELKDYQDHCVSVGTASIVKLASNAYHALKVCFANEVGRICLAEGIDSHEVMNVFKQDTTLNISDLYLQPGFAFGGSCLSKDISGLLSVGERHYKKKKETFRVIESIQKSNDYLIEKAEKLIKAQAESIGNKNIGFFGLSFKSDTDDMRGSPTIELINKIGRGYSIKAFDYDLIKTKGLFGVNLEQWEQVLKTFEIERVENIPEITESCRILVIAKPLGTHLKKLQSELTNQHCLIDLIGEFSKSNDFPCRIHRLV